jgi:ATP-binding cassette, subfamily B, bacterial
MHKPKNMTIVLKTLSYLYPIVWKEKPMFFMVFLLNILVNALLPFINIFFLKFLIDSLIGTQQLSDILLYSTVLVLGNATCYLLMNLFSGIIGKYDDAFSRYFEKQLSLKAMSLSYDQTEDTAVLDQIEKATTGMTWYSGGVVGISYAFTRIISALLTMLGTSAIIITRTPLLIPVIVIGLLINAILNSKANAIQVKHFLKLADLNRAFSYIYWNITDFKYGKDIRLYHASDMLLHKANSYNDEQTNKWREQSQEVNQLYMFDSVMSALSDGITYLYLGYLALKKLITIGDFTLLGTTTTTLRNNIQVTVQQLQELQKRCIYAYEFVSFMDYPSRTNHGDRQLTTHDQHVIEFNHVTFRYPNTDVDVLKDVSLTLRPGEHLSIVGLNGAGKTTFIKLLCRLYDVSEGEILLDGINIKEYDEDAYMKLFSVVFQDFKLFSFTIKDNISLNDSATCDDTEVLDYLKLAGLEDRINTLEKGIETTLFKQFEETGIEPSGGEQQKLAIARALYKNAPIVILDEPTAALDPIAEYDIYRQFDQLVGGKTTIYISHRLSSCKFCDKIAVFSHGTVSEYGTHDELTALEGGLYRDMFEAQAQYYC